MIYPHPIYDSDCILACCLRFLLLRAMAADGDGGEPARREGAAVVSGGGQLRAVPIFVKQNIGRPVLRVRAIGRPGAAVAMERVRAGSAV